MIIENIRQFIAKKAKEFGAKTGNEFNKSYVERNNTG
jgi:5-methylcytosine-specific restriction protein B